MNNKKTTSKIPFFKKESRQSLTSPTIFHPLIYFSAFLISLTLPIFYFLVDLSTSLCCLDKISRSTIYNLYFFSLNLHKKKAPAITGTFMSM